MQELALGPPRDHQASAEVGQDDQAQHVIDDGGIAAQRCEAVDIDGDGDLDLIASGGSTHNVKWYENKLR